MRLASWTEGNSQRCRQPSRNTPVKALVTPVLPRAARINEVWIDRLRSQPSRDWLCNKLWAIVTLHIGRSATLGKEPLEHLDHIGRCYRPGTGNGQALARVFIEHRQAFQPSPIGRLVVDKIIAPDVMGIRSPRRGGRAHTAKAVSYACASLPGAPPAAVDGGRSRDLPSSVRPSAG